MLREGKIHGGSFVCVSFFLENYTTLPVEYKHLDIWCWLLNKLAWLLRNEKRISIHCRMSQVEYHGALKTLHSHWLIINQQMKKPYHIIIIALNHNGSNEILNFI